MDRCTKFDVGNWTKLILKDLNMNSKAKLFLLLIYLLGSVFPNFGFAQQKGFKGLQCGNQYMICMNPGPIPNFQQFCQAIYDKAGMACNAILPAENNPVRGSCFQNLEPTYINCFNNLGAGFPEQQLEYCRANLEQCNSQ